jgi:hypothetical protein
MAAVASPAILDEYERLMHACGGELSKGKHCRSEYRGVFVEKLVEFKYEETVPFVTERPVWLRISRKRRRLTFEGKHHHCPHNVEPLLLDVVPIKGFFECGVQQPMRKSPTALPDWVVAGEVSEALRLDGVSPYQNFMLCRVAFPKATKQLRDHRIPPYLPRFLGGGGLVPMTGDDTKIKRLASKGYRKALTSLLTDESTDRDPQILSRIWLCTKERYASWVSQEIDGFLKTIDHHLGDSPPEDGRQWDDCGTDFLENALSRLNQRCQLAYEIPPQEVRLSMVAKSLSKRIDTLSGSWQSCHGWSKSISATREVYAQLVEQSRVWLPPTEDPTRMGVMGTPFWSNPRSTDQLRRLVIDAMVFDYSV